MSKLERLWYPSTEEGLAQRAAYAPLSLASLVFGAAVGARNALYERGALAVQRISGARVVSIGNLNVGGAGKTPAVIHLARLAASRGRKVAVLSRGYGRTSTAELSFTGAQLPSAADAGDEPVLIARRCPDATVMVGPDRAALAARARDAGAELILLDDGMQHRRLARDVEIVVIDEAAGFGNGKLLPRGPLREPLSSLARADLIWLRVASAPAHLPGLSAPTVRTRYMPSMLIAPDKSEQPISALRGQSATALAALARPGNFLATLDDLGITVVERRLFPDHHRFEPGDLRSPPAPFITTEKDHVRMPADVPAWVVRMEVEILEGEALLLQKLGL